MMTSDTKLISLGIAIVIGLGILIFSTGGWTGLGFYVVALVLIFIFAG